MEAAAHDHHHEPMPTSGRALDGVAFSATLHCLTGCAIGEILGMVIGTALGFSDWGTIALAVALAFLFGYGLTSLPLLRAGFALATVVPIALATDTFSIAVMEVVDNAIMLAVPGAMEAGAGDILFWGALSVALVVAGIVAFPVNRWLIARGKGHAVVHETGVHGGPPTRLVAAIAAVAAIFGVTVLATGAGGEAEHDGHRAPSAESAADRADPVRGLAASSGGLTLRLSGAEVPRGRPAVLRFHVTGADGRAVRDYEVTHEKRMHVILARRDLTGFQHLHPTLAGDGTWSTRLTVPEAGRYRVFADFKRKGANHTLGTDLAVGGTAKPTPLPPAATTARTPGGYSVTLEGAAARPRTEADLRFTVTRAGRPVAVQPYLGAGGHLVALRQGDLAYLHVHPIDDRAAGSAGRPVAFATEFPTAGRYRLFLQFKHEGRVRTAAFTSEVPGTAGGGSARRPGARPESVQGAEHEAH